VAPTRITSWNQRRHSFQVGLTATVRDRAGYRGGRLVVLQRIGVAHIRERGHWVAQQRLARVQEWGMGSRGHSWRKLLVGGVITGEVMGTGQRDHSG
jgi:hypothetical protein